jgi:hypothetical protein
MDTLAALTARVAALEDMEAIKRLKYAYWRCLDTKSWDELAGCFTTDATVDYGSGQYCFRGVDAIIGFLRNALGGETGHRGLHHGHHPEITLTGPTTAEGTWALYNYFFNTGQDRCARIGAFYHDRYQKLADGWKIAHTGYSTAFHEEWRRSDTPSLHLVAP